MNKELKSKEVRRIELISAILLAASIAAIVLGAVMTVKGIVGLAANGQNIGKLEKGELITEIAEGLVLVIHYYFVGRFLQAALKEGVPVTHEAAKELKILGLETIILPLLVMLLRLFLLTGLKPVKDLLQIEIYETILGVFLIQTGYVLEYATKKIEAGHKRHLLTEKLKHKYPNIYEELENELSHPDDPK